MSYIERIIEEDLLEKLSASGAVLIKGPKSCGKTETAKQFAKSILEMDRDKQVPVIMATNPRLLLVGETPRLINKRHTIYRIFVRIAGSPRVKCVCQSK